MLSRLAGGGGLPGGGGGAVPGGPMNFLSGAGLVLGTAALTSYVVNKLSPLHPIPMDELTAMGDGELKTFATASRSSMGGSDTAKANRILAALEAKRRGLDLGMGDAQKQRIVREAQELGISPEEITAALAEANIDTGGVDVSLGDFF